MRTTTAAIDAALIATNVPMLVLVEMDFASGFLRANNSGMDIIWDSKTWLGVGAVGGIDPVQEMTDMSAMGLSFTLSGVPTAYISLAIGQNYQGRACKIWFAILNAGHQVIADPIGPFSYRMDTMDIELGQTATIKVAAESRLVDWEKVDVSRYTNEEQQHLYPGDIGLEFVPQMVEKELRWGY